MTQAVTTTHSLRATVREWWRFVRRPHLPSAELRGFSRANLAGAGRVFVVNALLSLGLLLVLEVAEQAIADVPEPTILRDAMADDPWPVVLLIGGLFAPFVEEVAFRSWLSGLVHHPPRWFHTAFPAIFWLQALGFAGMHLWNYDEATSPLMMVMVLPQLIGGLSFGYARLRFGWWAAVLIHSAHNTSVIMIAMIGAWLGAGG